MKNLIIIPLVFLITLTSNAIETNYVVKPNSFDITHGSSLVLLPDDKMLSCFFAGSGEAQFDTKIYCSKFDGETWGSPKIVVNRQERSMWSLYNSTVGNSVLHYDKHGRLWMFYVAVPFGGWAAAGVHYKVSTDEGETWSRGRRLTKGLGKLARNKLIELEDGSFLLPLYHEFRNTQGTIYHLFPNDPPRNFIGKWSWRRIPGNHHIQPSLLREPNSDKVHIYMRNMKRGKTFYSSMNVGDLPKLNYEKPRLIELPNPNSSLDTIMHGDYALAVYNNSPEERNVISLAYSTDFVNFTPIYDFEKTDNKDDKFAYPTLIKDEDGNFRLAYSYRNIAIKYVKFTASEVDEWIQNKQK